MIRLPATYAGPDAIKSDRALYLALEAEILANKALGIDLEESTVHEFARKVIQLTKEKVLLESTQSYLSRWLEESERNVLVNKLAKGSHKSRKGVIKIYLEYIGTESNHPLGSMFTFQKMKHFLSSIEEMNP